MSAFYTMAAVIFTALLIALIWAVVKRIIDDSTE